MVDAVTAFELAKGSDEKTTATATSSNEDKNTEPPNPSVIRNLKIKCGIVKRLAKDKQSYEKEVVEQTSKIEKFKSEGKDESFMRNQMNCLHESKMMIPDVIRRLVTAFDELKGLVETLRGTREGKTLEFTEAIRILDEAMPHIDRTY